MKRSLGRLAMNWLRNPRNQEKVKQTARQLYDRYQHSRNGRNSSGRVDRSAPDAPAQTRRETPNSDRDKT